MPALPLQQHPRVASNGHDRARRGSTLLAVRWRVSRRRAGLAGGNMKKKKLAISDDLQLPIDSINGSPGAIWQKYAFLGRTGSGKTYAAKKLAELMLEAGAQVIVL